MNRTEEEPVTDVVPVPVRLLDTELPLPAYAHPGDAGADLVAAADVELPPGGRALVPTGVAIALPQGYVGLVHPRSGLAARLGVTVLNAPGTVDAGYRGEILVNLINHDRETPAKISAAIGSRSSWSRGSRGHGSSRWPSCPNPSVGPAGTAPPAGTPAWCRPRRGRTGSGRSGTSRAAGGRKRWQGEYEQRRAGAVIFSRKRDGAGRQTRDERAAEVLDEGSATPALVRGPYDISEVDDEVQRLDLGSLHIPAIAEVEVRVQADPQGVVQQVVLVHGENALQLGVFAAPRSEGIWDEVREEIRQSLVRDGATTRAVEGEYGTELYAEVNTQDGPTNLRFVGIDGPRWMVAASSRARWPSTRSSPGPSPSAWTAWWSTGVRRRSRSASRCRCGCPGRSPTRPPPSLARPDRHAPARRNRPRRRTLAARFRRRRGQAGAGERGEGDAEVMTTDESRVSLRRILQRFTASEAEIDAQELRRESAECGGIPAQQCSRGQVVSVAGRLRTVVYTPRTNLPTLEADLYDGSDVVTLVWLGRRHIAGIEPGRHLTARGRVAMRDDRKVIYNPYYELDSPK
ncbi:hypothetical protein GCM10027614_68610 [Micromonospora vulcania]